MKVVVKFTITMNVDNTVDTLLSDITLVSQNNNNIDIFHHFSWDYVEEVTVKNKFTIQNKISQINLSRTRATENSTHFLKGTYILSIYFKITLAISITKNSSVAYNLVRV